MAGRAVRAWPCRSTSRAVHGATSPVAASPVAVTAPARAYEPRAPAIIMTALTLNMPIGRRASRCPAVKARAPGISNRRWYGESCGMRPPSPGGDRAVQHLFRAQSRTWVVNPRQDGRKAAAKKIRSLFFIQGYGDS